MLRCVDRFILRLRRDDGGNALVEFAFVSPVLILLLFSVIDFGSNIYGMLTLRSAARVGAEFAMSRPTDTSGIEAAVLGASDFGSASVLVTSSIFCECPDGTAHTCGGTCTAPGLERAYVRVRAQQAFTPMLPSSAVVMPTTLAGESVMRFR